jgi:hypothetical protein
MIVLCPQQNYGAAAQVFLCPSAPYVEEKAQKYGVKLERIAYIIRNSC